MGFEFGGLGLIRVLGVGFRAYKGFGSRVLGLALS